MSYIGVQPTAGQYRKLDNIASSFNGATTTFTTSVGGINVTAGTPQQLLVSVGGVIQQPVTDYTTSTNSITFSTAPAAGLDFFAVLMGDAINIGTPSDGSVTTSKLSSNLTVDLASGSAAAPSLTFDANTGVFSPGEDLVAISTGGTERTRIDSLGRVGIGITSPNSRLETNELSNGAESFPLYVSNTGSGVNTRASIRFNVASSYYGSIGGGAEADGSSSVIIDAASSTGITKFTRNNKATETARFDGSGRLLVGTSTAQGSNPLQVESAGAGIFIRRSLPNSSIGAGNGIGLVDFGNQDGGVGARIEGVGDAGWGANDYPGRLVFSTTADGASSPTERMRITSTGYVGFNTSSFSSTGQLATNQGTNYYNFGANNSNAFIVYNSSNTGVYLVSGNTGWSANSDERLKTNLEPIADGLNKVGALRAVTGRYKTDEETISRSFLIAQDVQQVLPEAVDVQDDEDKTLGLRYTEVIPLLVAALKESKERIETLEAKVAALEGA